MASTIVRPERLLIMPFLLPLPRLLLPQHAVFAVFAAAFCASVAPSAAAFFYCWFCCCLLHLLLLPLLGAAAMASAYCEAIQAVRSAVLRGACGA